MKINLLELLKGHEGESFYSPAFGNITFIGVDEDSADNYPLEFEDANGAVYLTVDGRYNLNAECTVFPSKGQRDWSKWAAEVKSLPKTWEEYKKTDKYNPETVKKLSSIGKQYLALYKINKLIEIGYGGNVTDKEWKNTDDWKYTINCVPNGTLTIERVISRAVIAFFSRDKAEQFLSCPNNAQLIEDFYGVVNS